MGVDMFINDIEYGRLTNEVWEAIEAARPDFDYIAGGTDDRVDVYAILMILLRILDRPRSIHHEALDAHDPVIIGRLIDLSCTVNFTLGLAAAISNNEPNIEIHWD